MPEPQFATIPGAIYGPSDIASALAIPSPASAVPPGVADTGASGAAATYARGDHTHASKVRKQRVACSAATLTWTYPTPFASGVVPIVNGYVETAPGVTDVVNVQTDGVPNNVSCTFRVTRYSQTLIGIVTGALAINATPLSIFIHATAGEP